MAHRQQSGRSWGSSHFSMKSISEESQTKRPWGQCTHSHKHSLTNFLNQLDAAHRASQLIPTLHSPLEQAVVQSPSITRFFFRKTIFCNFFTQNGMSNVSFLLYRISVIFSNLIMKPLRKLSSLHILVVPRKSYSLSCRHGILKQMNLPLFDTSLDFKR